MAGNDGARRAFAFIKIILNIVVGMCLPIAMIVIGALYWEECPREPLIPPYLVVFGSTLLVMSLACTLYLCVVSRRAVVLLAIAVSVVLALFNIAWLIAGSVWVFGSHDDYDPDKLHYPTNATLAYNTTSSTIAYTTAHNTTELPHSLLNARYCCSALHQFAFAVTIVFYVFMLLTLLYEIYNMLLTACRTCGKKGAKAPDKNHVVARSEIKL